MILIICHSKVAETWFTKEKEKKKGKKLQASEMGLFTLVFMQKSKNSELCWPCKNLSITVEGSTVDNQVVSYWLIFHSRQWQGDSRPQAKHLKGILDWLFGALEVNNAKLDLSSNKTSGKGCNSTIQVKPTWSLSTSCLCDSQRYGFVKLNGSWELNADFFFFCFFKSWIQHVRTFLYFKCLISWDFFFFFTNKILKTTFTFMSYHKSKAKTPSQNFYQKPLLVLFFFIKNLVVCWSTWDYLD